MTDSKKLSALALSVNIALFSSLAHSAAFNEITNGTLSAGDTAESLFAYNGANITISGAAVIDNSVNGHRIGAVYAMQGGKIDLGTGSKVTGSYNPSNSHIYGVLSEGSTSVTGTYIKGNNLTVTASHSDLGLVVSGIAANGVAGNYAESTIELTGVTTIDVTSNNGLASGIHSQFEGAKLTADRLDVTSFGNDSANGISAQVGGKLTYNNAAVDVSGKGDLIGLNAFEGTLTANNSTSIKLTGSSIGDRYYGVYAYNNGGNFDSLVNLNGATDITINVTDIGSAAYGVYSGGRSQVNTKDVIINLNSDPSSYNLNVYGVYAAKESVSLPQAGNITINGNLVINSSGPAKPIYVLATSGARVELNGSVTLGAGNQVGDVNYAMYTYGANSIITSQNRKMTVVGNIFASQGTIDLAANNGSHFTGASHTGASGVYNLSLANGSLWDMTADSRVTSLTLDNSSRVNFTSYANSGAYSTLTAASLSGAGKFAMNVDMPGQQGDLLKVTGTSSGNHQLLIADDGSVTVDGTETLTLVTTSDGAAAFSSSVGLGGYQYELRKAANGLDWELYSTGRASPSANASASLMEINYLMNYVDNQTLFQRMGNIHNDRQYSGDVWGRTIAGKVNMGANGKLSGFDMKYSGVYLGADKQLNSDSGRLYLGGMVGYVYSDNDYERGSGKAKNYNFGLYSTYIADSGLYIDAILKYNHARNKYDVLDGANKTINGAANSDGYGASVEIGQRFTLADGPFYFEPQAQLSWLYQGSAESNDTSGLTVKLDSYNSTLGRISGVIGYDNQTWDSYLKLGYVRELAGNSSYHLNSNTETFEHHDGWLDLGLGVSAKIRQNHNLYGEVSYADGGRFEQKQINLGYRYQF